MWRAPGGGLERVRAAWAGVANVPSLARLQVLVQPVSMLCPPGSVGVLVIDDTIIDAVRPSEITTMSEVGSLLEQVGVDDLNESGLAEVTSPLYVERGATGIPVAAYGYRHWPQDVAHLSVLVHPDHRGRGYARRVAARAVAAALEDGLLPQWRAHPEASKAVARHLGLTEVGSQLSFRLGPDR